MRIDHRCHGPGPMPILPPDLTVDDMPGVDSALRKMTFRLYQIGNLTIGEKKKIAAKLQRIGQGHRLKFEPKKTPNHPTP